MINTDNKHQKNRKALTTQRSGEALCHEPQRNVLSVTYQQSEILSCKNNLMEAICERENLKLALKRTEQNKGSPGIDGMTSDELKGYLVKSWLRLKEELMKGEYKPQPVKTVEIPKADGKGVRKLGIPTVVDRFIQQAMLQVLTQEIEHTFSDHSYGFRPGRSAHQAVKQAQSYIEQGYGIVVDIDLKNFFNTVNHDKLMSELSKRIEDKGVLKLIRSYLNVGVMQSGEVTYDNIGTPQGGPLSPLLSNIMLDLLDNELGKRGHKFVRYADDCNVYVKSIRAGQRVMQSLEKFLKEKLKLDVNTDKSRLDKAYKRVFLGFGFTSGRTPKRRIAPLALKRLKKKVREYTRCSKGMNMEKVIGDLSKYLKGWYAYFGICQTPSVLKDLDSWIRRRLRCGFWRQWKTGKNRKTQLHKRGVDHDLAIRLAGTNKGPWHTSKCLALNMALSNNSLTSLGLFSLGNQKQG